MTEGKMLIELFPESNITKKSSLYKVAIHLESEFDEVADELNKIMHYRKDADYKKAFDELDDLMMMCQQAKYKICEEFDLDKEGMTHNSFKTNRRKLEGRGTI